MTRNRLKPGTIIWEKYKGHYFFYRILLDLKKVHKNENFPESGWFNFIYSNCYVLEVYKGIYKEPVLTSRDIIIKGLFISDSSMHSFKKYDGEGWEVYDFEPINMETLDLPEKIINLTRREVVFEKGPLEYHYTPELSKELRNHDSIVTSYVFSLTIAAMNAVVLQGRRDLAFSTNYKYNSHDLRDFPDLRRKIYQDLGLDMKMPFYELCLRNGFDLKELFK